MNDHDSTTQQTSSQEGELFDIKEIRPLVPFQQQLTELEAANSVLVFDYADKDGNKEARSHVRKLRLVKGELERTRKAAKAHAIAYGKAVDEEAGKLEERIEAMIEVHARPIREQEEKEEKRLAAIEARLKVLRDLIDAPNTGRKYTSAEVAGLLKEAQDFVCGEELQESLQEGQALRTHAIATLQRYLEDVQKAEADAAELQRLRDEQAQREREEKLRQLQAEQAQQEAARLAKAEADAKAALQAKLKALGDLAKGLVNGKEVTSAVLLHEISKVSIDDDWGDFKMVAEIALQGAKLYAEKLSSAERELAEAARQEEQRQAEAQRQADALAHEQREQQAREEGKRQALLAQEAEAARQEQEELARKADEDHRRAVIEAAEVAMVEGGLGARSAKLAIDLILQGLVPAVSIQF